MDRGENQGQFYLNCQVALAERAFKLLEKMPPIEVFVGLDALKTSAEEVPGLPTRSELQQWVVDHDAIEKETEIFDTGELKKLRKFTRGLSIGFL